MRRLAPLATVVLLGRMRSNHGTAHKLNPTGTQLTGKFVWFDLVTEDVTAIEQFYGGLLAVALASVHFGAAAIPGASLACGTISPARRSRPTGPGDRIRRIEAAAAWPAGPEARASALR